MVVWFITGCSSGFGQQVAKAALARGDKVVATARNASKLEDLQKLGALTLSIDVTDAEVEIERVVSEAIKAYGTIDILLNNAGVILEGAIEEASDTEIKTQFQINVFGQLAITRAVLPHMRSHKSGVIANMGSVGGWAGGVGCGFYCATKFAMVGITQALRDEVKHLGINVTIIEPGYFRTNFLGAGAKITAKKVIDDLKPVMDPLRSTFEMYNGRQPGDPGKGGKLIVEALTGTGRCAGRTLPARLAIGSDAVGMIAGILESEKKDLEAWKELSAPTDHDK